MILFVVDEDRERYRGRAVRASILAHACLMQGLEVSFMCAEQDVHDCLTREGSSGVRVVDREQLIFEAALERPTLLVWDAARPLTHKEVTLFHQHDTFVVEFDAPDGESRADEVVNGFESTLRSARGRQYKLIGPGYLVVDKCFTNAREWRRASAFLGNGLDLFICLDGVEPEIVTSTLDVLADIPACRSMQIRIMAGADEKRGRAVQRSFSSFKNLQLYTGTNSALIAQLMRFSQLGIISFGPLLIQAMAAELPVLMINSTEGDERYAARVLNGVFAGAGLTFGYAQHIDWGMFQRKLAFLLERPREIERMQEATHRLVDGQGAQRIARFIQSHRKIRGMGHGDWVAAEGPRTIIPLTR
ncbi:MAG TPA: hypothetical protein VMT71_16605 [Syntrophorhabdales bacterium]|nr:hypothetical protein [Syntrophorhabdales bacterium]